MINEKDVDEFFTKQTIGHRPKASSPRSLTLQSGHMRLTHEPTGTQVFGEIPEGYYTRNEFRRYKDKIRTELMYELNKKVKS